MLEVVFDRLERMLTTSVRNFTSENVDISLENISAQRFSDYMNSVSAPAMIAIFKAVQWDNYGLITVDSAMIYSIVDVLLGGRRGTVADADRGAALHHDRGVAGRAPDPPDPGRSGPGVRADHAGQVPLRADGDQPALRGDRPARQCLHRASSCASSSRIAAARIEFLIPYATLEPARDLLLQMFMGEKFGRDSIWENHLARRDLAHRASSSRRCSRSRRSACATCCGLQVGSTLPLNAPSDPKVSLRCGQVPMAQRPDRPHRRPAGDQGRGGHRAADGAAAMIELAANLLVAFLLVLTTSWCVLLYRRLGRLRVERSDIEAFVTAIDAASRRAEAAIAGIRDSALEAQRALGGQQETGAAARRRADPAGRQRRPDGAPGRDGPASGRPHHGGEARARDPAEQSLPAAGSSDARPAGAAARRAARRRRRSTPSCCARSRRCGEPSGRAAPSLRRHFPGSCWSTAGAALAARRWRTGFPAMRGS